MTNPTTVAKLFTDFPLHPDIQRALDDLKFTSPTEVQEKSFPYLLEDKKTDFHGQAQTGTGKTLAFGIPAIQKIDVSLRHPQVLIVAPTRELVVQICDSLRAVAKYRKVTIEPIYGGLSMYTQIRALKSGVQIVVGTPGRLNDHLRRKTLNLENLDVLVLDEADIMLDMGFKEEVDEILNYAPKERQIWLFSATVKEGIKAIQRNHMRPEVVSVKSECKKPTANVLIKQYFSVVPSRVRLQALCRFIENEPEFYGLVFCQTKVLAGEVAERLTRRGFAAQPLHGDMSQMLRNNVISQFKKRSFSILVATDVAARGIDISDLSHVVNYSLPEDEESYLHRVGRTGRAGKTGIAITFVNRGDLSRLKRIASKFSSTIDPIEVPGLEQLLTTRVNRALSHLETTNIDDLKSNEQYKAALQQLMDIVQELSEQELKDGIVRLLAAQFLKGHSQDDEAAFQGSDSSAGYDSNQAVDARIKEITLNVGIEDGVSKEEVMALCLSVDGIQADALEKVRVIRKKSFITAPTAKALAIADGLRGQELGGQRLRPMVGDVVADDRGGNGGGFRGRGGEGRSGGFRSRGGEGRSSFSRGGEGRGGEGGGYRGRSEGGYRGASDSSSSEGRSERSGGYFRGMGSDRGERSGSDSRPSFSRGGSDFAPRGDRSERGGSDRPSFSRGGSDFAPRGERGDRPSFSRGGGRSEGRSGGARSGGGRSSSYAPRQRQSD